MERSADEAMELLGSDERKGLSGEEAAKRSAKFGPNEVPEEKERSSVKFGRKFWGFTAWMLELVMVFSLAIRDYFDFYIIGGLLIVNAAIGFVQEQKASGAVEALRQHLRINARVLRDGRWAAMPARELVPGDIVRVRAGDFVPADLKVIGDGILNVDQSALTGESQSAEKKRDSALYSGSVVKNGEALAVVVATGESTFFGRTTELLQSARPKLHMEEVTSGVVKWLLLMVGVLIVLVFVFSYARGDSLLQVVPLALVLVAFAVPVALPAMFTVSMALGSLELANEGVLVTRLGASEDAASMDVLCADKTGTITANKLAVADVVASPGFQRDELLLYGSLASQEADQDPIDMAFISAARSKSLPLSSFSQESFTPFDPRTRRTEAIVTSDGRRVRVMKGAVETILQVCGLDPKTAGTEERMEDLASRGYRTLGVAVAEDEGRYAFCGMVALYDAPRPDSKEFIGRLEALGVSVKMLTGDALPVAREIASQVGLGSRISRAPEFRSLLEKEPSKAEETVEVSDGFAEVYPEDKYSIVRKLQSAGHVTGMTGDGVNDAPALKQAEVGIAVSSATDVAKGAASAVLTAEGLSNVIGLVQVGRRIYQRIVTWILNKVVKTFEVSIFVSLAFLLTGYYVVAPIDIVLLLFLVDFTTIALATDSVGYSMRPDRWDVPGLVKVSVMLGVVTVIELFGLLWLALHRLGLSGDQAGLQTFVFASLFYLGMLTLVIVRERKSFWRSRPSRTLFAAVLLDAAVVAAIVTVGLPGVRPIPPSYLVLVVSYVGLLSLTVNDQIKQLLLKRISRS